MPAHVVVILAGGIDCFWGDSVTSPMMEKAPMLSRNEHLGLNSLSTTRVVANDRHGLWKNRSPVFRTMKIISTYRSSWLDPYTHIVEIPAGEILRWRTLPQPPVDLGRAREAKRSQNYHITLTSRELRQLADQSGDPQYQTARWHVYLAGAEKRLPSLIVNRVLGALDCYPCELTLEQFRELLTVCRPKHFGVGQTGLDHLRRVFLGSPDLLQTAGRRAGWTG
jgi:hypothetical protein